MAQHLACLPVEEMVADPTTRVPSYSTTDGPGATPGSGRSNLTSTLSPSAHAVAGTSSPCARTCAPTDTTPSGARPHQRAWSPVISSTPSSSAVPTTTVLV